MARSAKKMQPGRAQQKEIQQERLRQKERARRQQRLIRVGGVLLAAVALAGALIFALTQSGGSTGAVVAASLGSPTSDLPSSPIGNFKKISTGVTSNGKPEVLFVGTQFCSFCAAERWSIVKALGQFGSWTNVHSARQGGNTAGFSSVPTLDLTSAHYVSRYVAFSGKDTLDYNSNPLQPLTAREQQLFNLYDPQGSTPMVLVSKYVMLGSGYSPGDIDGRSFSDVQSALKSGSKSKFVSDINSETNVVVSILCKADGMKPAQACNRPVIKRNVARIT